MSDGHLMGVREAAAALGVSASTISRYLAKYAELNRAGSGKRPLVNLAELRDHRASTLVAPAADDVTEPRAATAPIGSQFSGDNVSYAAARASRESTRADKEKIELDELRERLVPTDEVEEAAAAAGQLLQAEFLDLAPRLADELAVVNDPKVIAGRLEAEFRRLLGRFAETLETRRRSHEAA